MPSRPRRPSATGDVAANIAAMTAAIRAQWPNRAERALLDVLYGPPPWPDGHDRCRRELVRKPLFDALVEVAVPFNAMDDHYLLFPCFAFRTLDCIGWEHAGKVLRPVVRWLSTVPPSSKHDLPGWAAARSVGGNRFPADWPRVQAIAEAHGILPAAAASSTPVDSGSAAAAAAAAGAPTTALVGAVEAARSVEALGRQLSARPAHTGTYSDDTQPVGPWFLRVAEAMAAALAGGGLSTAAALDGLSLGSVRLYLATDMGNPFDVHLLTGVGARRYMQRAGVAERTQRLSMLLWGSGFEVYQLTSFKLWDYFANTAAFGADHVPARGAALLPTLAARSPADILDEITAAIAVRPPLHSVQMRALMGGAMEVVAPRLGSEVPLRVWPLIWAYLRLGGSVPDFFGRMCQLTAMDDFTELHLVKMMAVCSEEADTMPAEYGWLYLCAAAKALAASFACSRVVYDLAVPAIEACEGCDLPRHFAGTAVGIGADGAHRAAAAAAASEAV